MLDIIITHYKEPWEVGKPLFDMLNLQRGIDFGQIHVMVINDGPENHLPDEVLRDYKYRVDQYDIPHGGVSAARNYGLEHASAEWINFCDFDDTYSNVYAIRDVLNVLTRSEYNLLWTKMMTEDFTDGQDKLYMTPEKSTFVFIHGKYYRRQWLVDSGIRFDTEFTFQEDSLFNAIILAVLDYKQIGMIKTFIPPYVWCRRGGSVTNSEENEDKAVFGHFRRNCKVCDFYYDHLPPERLNDMIIRTTYDTYFMLNAKHNITDEVRNQIIERFQDLIRKYKDFYVRPDDETLVQIAAISSAELMNTVDEVPTDFETVTAWKDMITREVS